MIHKEAWYKELLAYFGEPDLNIPDSLDPFLQKPHAYTVGYDIQVLTNPEQVFHGLDSSDPADPEAPDRASWKTIKHGQLSQGGFTNEVVQKLAALPAYKWYPVQGYPPVWQLDLQGKWPFGPSDWNLFGFSSQEWEALADQYESDLYEIPGIRGEFQFQIRPAGEFGDVEEGRAQEVLQNSRLRAQDLLKRLMTTQAPPSYASWLSEQYRDFRSFLGKVNLEDVDTMGRFLRMEKQLLDFHQDMNTAAEESLDSTRFPVVGVVPGLYEYILTGEGSPGVVPEEQRRPEWDDGRKGT